MLWSYGGFNLTVTPKFSVPLAAKLCVRPPNVSEVQERARGPLSPCQVWCGSDFARRRVGEKTLIFCLSVTPVVRDPKPGFLDEPVIVSYTLRTSFFKYFNVFGWGIKRMIARPDQLRTHKIFKLNMDTLPRNASASRIRCSHNKITNMTDILVYLVSKCEEF